MPRSLDLFFIHNLLLKQLRSHQSRAIDAMKLSNKGCIYVPTGGGKTAIMIEDLKSRINVRVHTPLTAVIVAPRILLAQQLSEEFITEVPQVKVLHVHSGETKHDRETKHEFITNWVSRHPQYDKLIFTTYHSLHKICDSMVNIDVLYCDEAHNSTSKNHFVGISTVKSNSSYFFTATPKYSRGNNVRGMNNVDVYGNTLISVPAPELVKNGTILAPLIDIHETNHNRTRYNAPEIDRKVILNIIKNIKSELTPKILVAAPNTKILWNMLTKSNIISSLKRQGYDIMHITSKHGAYINRKKVNRQVFFDTLRKWGDDDNKKFVLFHYSILSEGINVPGLTHTILLRNLPIIEMAQTIGRVIRLHKYDYNNIHNNTIEAGNVKQYHKKHGVVTVPINSKSSVATRNRLQKLIELIFEDGLTAHSFAY